MFYFLRCLQLHICMITPESQNLNTDSFLNPCLWRSPRVSLKSTSMLAYLRHKTSSGMCPLWLKTCTNTLGLFSWVLEIKLRSSCLHVKHFSNRTICSVLPALLISYIDAMTLQSHFFLLYELQIHMCNWTVPRKEEIVTLLCYLSLHSVNCWMCYRGIQSSTK